MVGSSNSSRGIEMNRLIILAVIALAAGLAHGDEGWVMCQECVGSGSIEIESICDLCQGEGGNWELCPCCGGTEFIDVSCSLCGGDGFVDCGWCGGDGYLATTAGNCTTELNQLCPACRFGQISCATCDESGIAGSDPCTICVGGEIWVDCAGCAGSGATSVTETCGSCSGQGGFWEEEE